MPSTPDTHPLLISCAVAHDTTASTVESLSAIMDPQPECAVIAK